MFVKLAKWLWDGDVNETTVKVDYEKKLEEEKARYLEELKRERERKEREEELDEIAAEVKKVKKKVEKIDYTALILEALQSDAVLEAFAKMTDERLHDHIGVTNLISEKIKEKIEPLEGKVTQIEEGVLAVETRLNSEGLVEYVEKTINENFDSTNRQYGSTVEAIQKATAKVSASNRKIRIDETTQNERLKVCKELQIKDSMFSKSSLKMIKAIHPCFMGVTFDTWFDLQIENGNFIEVEKKANGYVYYQLAITPK
jgi:hypothetical protein